MKASRCADLAEGRPGARRLFDARFRRAYGRVARLAAFAHVLCDRQGASDLPMGTASAFHFVVDELDGAAHWLAKHAAALGLADGRGRRRRAAGGRRRAAAGARPLSSAVARFYAECVACGREVCALFGLARAIDAPCAWVASRILRVLDCLIWQLRPFSKPAPLPG